jgi:DNA polymerase-3 subunit chi
MAEFRFYHLTRYRLEEALVRLLRRASEQGSRAVVVAGSTERVEALNAHLWTFDAESFLPHGSARDGNAEEQPAYLTATIENPNAARVLMLCDGATLPVGIQVASLGFDRVFELFDGQDEAAVQVARQHWQDYRDAGLDLVYYQQDEAGGWIEKARHPSKPQT